MQLDWSNNTRPMKRQPPYLTIALLTATLVTPALGQLRGNPIEPTPRPTANADRLIDKTKMELEDARDSSVEVNQRVKKAEPGIETPATSRQSMKPSEERQDTEATRAPLPELPEVPSPESVISENSNTDTNLTVPKNPAVETKGDAEEKSDKKKKPQKSLEQLRKEAATSAPLFEPVPQIVKKKPATDES